MRLLAAAALCLPLIGCTAYLSPFGPKELIACKDDPIFNSLQYSGAQHRFVVGGLDKYSGAVRCYAANRQSVAAKSCKSASRNCSLVMLDDKLMLYAAVRAARTTQPSNLALPAETQSTIGYVAGRLLACALLGSGACAPSGDSIATVSRAEQPPIEIPINPRLAPDSTYVSGKPVLCPDGSWVSGKCNFAPDGSYVGPGSPQLAPNGSWVGGKPALCPDGSYVAGTCRMAPNGKYIGN